MVNIRSPSISCNELVSKLTTDIDNKSNLSIQDVIKSNDFNKLLSQLSDQDPSQTTSIGNTRNKQISVDEQKYIVLSSIKNTNSSKQSKSEQSYKKNILINLVNINGYQKPVNLNSSLAQQKNQNLQNKNNSINSKISNQTKNDINSIDIRQSPSLPVQEFASDEKGQIVDYDDLKNQQLSENREKTFSDTDLETTDNSSEAKLAPNKKDAGGSVSASNTLEKNSTNTSLQTNGLDLLSWIGDETTQENNTNTFSKNSQSLNNYKNDIKENSQNIKLLNEPENQSSNKTISKYDIQNINNKNNYNNNTISETYNLDDKQIYNQKTDSNITYQDVQLKDFPSKTNIDTKLLSSTTQNNNQSTYVLSKTVVQDDQIDQLLDKELIRNKPFNMDNTVDSEGVQTGTINTQTNSIQSAPQIKSNSNVSNHMQTIIDKILEIKNLNPPVLKTITIQLNPPSLGSLDLKVSLDSNKNLTADINVQSQDLFNALNNNLDSLKNILQNHGFNVAQINVTSNQNSQNSNQNPQNQQQTFMQFNDNSQFSQNKHGQGTFNQAFSQSRQQQEQNYFVSNNTEKVNQVYKTSSYLVDIVI